MKQRNRDPTTAMFDSTKAANARLTIIFISAFAVDEFGAKTNLGYT